MHEVSLSQYHYSSLTLALGFYSEDQQSAFQHCQKYAYSMTEVSFDTPPNKILKSTVKDYVALSPKQPLPPRCISYPQATWIQNEKALIVSVATKVPELP